jgi:hypothetical protein
MKRLVFLLLLSFTFSEICFSHSEIGIDYHHYIEKIEVTPNSIQNCSGFEFNGKESITFKDGSVIKFTEITEISEIRQESTFSHQQDLATDVKPLVLLEIKCKTQSKGEFTMTLHLKPFMNALVTNLIILHVETLIKENPREYFNKIQSELAIMNRNVIIGNKVTHSLDDSLGILIRVLTDQWPDDVKKQQQIYGSLAKLNSLRQRILRTEATYIHSITNEKLEESKSQKSGKKKKKYVFIESKVGDGLYARTPVVGSKTDLKLR